jgi:long-subunit acyl-CoA synthetase (AMP-forming)
VSPPLRWLRRGDPVRDVLLGAGTRVSAVELAEAVERAADTLRAENVRVIATRLDNGPAWAITDLAAWHAGIVHVPLPAFFTASQLAHVLAATGADALLEAGGDGSIGGLPAGTRLTRRATTPVKPHDGTAKVSFTSGSTGQPRGACLSGETLAAVAEGIAAALGPIGIRRHLAVLPLPVLLENVAGLYAPLAAGAAVVLPASAEVGLHGSSRFDPDVLQRAVHAWQPDSVIVLPQMLRAWAARRRPDDPAPRFVAVGGAAVGASTIARARAAGIPAYEGYGLTEGGSVQTLNLPGADRPGSVGRALPHARVRLSGSGEIEVSGAPMLGYLSQPAITPRAWWATGDVGRIDPDGFVHVDGRRDALIVTAFGRNVSPEWVETALQSQPAVAHAVVSGAGEPALHAVLWPTRDDLPQRARDAALAAAVEAANTTLPDYARVGHWIVADVPFDAAAGMATANGRPLREAIARRFHAAVAVAHDSGEHLDDTFR